MPGLTDSIGGPLSNSLIRRQALNLRFALAVDKDPAPDLARLLEHTLPALCPSFQFRIEDDGSLGGDGALTDWDPPTIMLSEQVYKNLCAGVGRARFTAAHEIGHLFLHPGATQARNTAHVRAISARHSVEVQANRFAVEFLMPHEIIKDCKVPLDVARLCKVSVEAGESRMRELAMWPRGEERQRVIEGFSELLKELKSKNPNGQR